VEYLRALRLNIARRRLRSTETEQLTVARVASDLGFSHLGHFSGAYRTLFGETPSQTPRAR
jgi:transcriptional regulator GlxA family with amidase domain